MYKKLIIVTLISLCTAIVSIGQQQSLTDLVEPLMGTLSKPSLSNGNTYPAIGVPWGMNYWTAQTGKNGNGWQYTYNDDKIVGFKQTHQPSPWMNDYGMFSIMPSTGKLKSNETERASWFSHKAEVVKPYYYSVYLADFDVTTAFTASERAAHFQFTFPAADTSSIIIDAFERGSHVKIIPKERKIIGYSTRYARGKYTNFKNYFVLYFDKDFDISKTIGEKGEWLDSLEVTNSHALGVVAFKTKKGEVVNCRTASSFISFEQAEINLKELGDKNQSFEKNSATAKNTWEKVLSRVQVSGGTIDQQRTFYSCLYRAVMFPNKLYEIDANKKIIHYSPYNGKIENGYMFAGTGFWDTFRALYPFLNLVYPSINKEMQEGLLNDYKEGGWLPEWSSPGYADIMVGNNSASVVSEAYIKGLRGYNIDSLYMALLHGANNEGPMSAVGRKGVTYYNKLAYVPYNVRINENAARTLEYAYDDFSIYQLAVALKRPKEEIELYARRCLNYRKLFDKSTNLMRGKNLDGTFQTPFNPLKWGDAFTEGNSWHYSWSVFHDIQGLINLMGIKKTFVNMLDSIFSMPPLFDDSYYGGTIHEIREMQIANFGQYAHGNQPIQHMIYLYNYAGEAYKTQHWAREVMNRLYMATPDGYCGDEDNGQTSAWYVFSAMGFYPVCPTTPEYVLGAPLFNKVTINLENGKQFVINAPANSAANKYVSSIKLNGKDFSKTFLNHFDVMKGGAMQFNMSNKPTLMSSTAVQDLPYSFSTVNPSIKPLPSEPMAALPDRRNNRQNDWTNIANNPIAWKDSTTKDGFTLIFVSQIPDFDKTTQQKLTNAFFATYPKEVARFNKNSRKTVAFIIDSSYKGVAAASNGIIRCNPKWLKDHPEDVDVMTHEVSHIVQGYKPGIPGWLVEGISDYIRYTYGVNNVKGGWTLPDYKASQSYTNAYRITARFLVWVEKNYDKEIVDKMNVAGSEGTYDASLWKQYTGKTVDELWDEYGKNPALELSYK